MKEILEKQAKDLTEDESKELDNHIKQAVVKGSKTGWNALNWLIAILLSLILFPIIMFFISLWRTS